MSKNPTLKVLAKRQLEKIEDYAIRSTVGRKLASMIYTSNIYSHLMNKIHDFRDLKLIRQIKQHPIPQHIAIIMDGNRRFASDLGLKPDAGHIFGRDKIEEVMDWCFDLGVKNLTLYAFSTENFHRASGEVQALMDLCKEELDKAANDSRIHGNKVRVNVLGKLESLPKDVQTSALYIKDKTSTYTDFTLNIALAYGGREEIVNAIQKIARDVRAGTVTIEDITEEKVSSYLYTKDIPDPDLVLRTSGEERISNFLLWQLAYSELYFSDVYWPAFQKRDFLMAIHSCQQRKRRYGI